MGIKGLLLFSLLVTVLQVRAQIACYPNSACGLDGSDHTVVATAEDCCLSDLNVTKSYRPSGSSTCQPCIVIGFNRQNVQAQENVQAGQEIDVGLLTRNPEFSDSINIASLDIVVEVNTLSTATIGSDFLLDGTTDRTQSYSTQVSFLPIKVEYEILADFEPGEEESFELTITSATLGQGLEILVGNSTTVVIVDDDVLDVGFMETEFSAAESDGQKEILFTIVNPIIVDTHFIVRPMTYQEYDDQHDTLRADDLDLPPFTLSDEYDQAEGEDFVQGDIFFTILANETEPSQPVIISLIDDDLLEPPEEGLRLLLMVDESKTQRSAVSFGRQLALLRIDDRDDTITFGFVNAEHRLDDVNGTHDIFLSLNITHGKTEIPIVLYFSYDGSDANVGEDFTDFSFNKKQIQPPNTFMLGSTFLVTVNGDDLFEGNETIVIGIIQTELLLPAPFISKTASPPNSKVKSPPDDSIILSLERTKILLQEGPQNLFVTLTVPQTINEGEIFYPVLTVSHEVNATFVVHLESGTATAEDYSPSFFERVEFGPSLYSNMTNSPVMVTRDDLVEPNETFFVTVTLTEPKSQSFRDLVKFIKPNQPITIIDQNTQECPVMLDEPENGDLNCPNGQVVYGSCDVTCDEGYEIIGPQTLTCLPNISWSDLPPSCQPLQCGEPRSLIPTNGYIVFPCSDEYNSTCNTGCFAGFSLTGSGEISCQPNESGIVEWNSRGTHCQYTGPCVPNPCLHGTCMEVCEDEFWCNCSGTFHTGDRCEHGVILVEVPILEKGQNPRNSLVTITINPDENVKVVLTLEEARGFIRNHRLSSAKQPLGTPPRLDLTFTSMVTKRTFSLFPNEAGRYSLHFSITVTSEGEIASIYPITLDHPVLVIDPSMEVNYFDHLDHHNRLLVPSGCNKPLFCPNSSIDIILSSSCGWNNHETGGIVFAYSSASDIYFPLSTIGARVGRSINNLPFMIEENFPCFECRSQELEDSLPTNYKLGSAYPYRYQSSATDSNEFVNRDSLAFTFLFVLKQSLLPSWLTISVPIATESEVRFSGFDLVNEVLSRDSIQNMEQCRLKTIINESMYIVLKHEGDVEFIAENDGENDSAILNGSIHPQKYLHCFAVSLCDSLPAVHVGFPIEASQSFRHTKFFKTLALLGWQFDVHSLSFNNPARRIKTFASFWNGVEESYLPPNLLSDVIMSGLITGNLLNYDTSVKVNIDGIIGYEYTIDPDEVDFALGRGNASLTLNTFINGAHQTLFLDKDHTYGFLYYTDNSSYCSSKDRPGIGLSLSYQPRAIDSDFFLDLFQLSPNSPSCDVDVFLNLDQQKKMDGLSFQTSCLGIKYDSLFFPSMMNVKTLINMNNDTKCQSNEDLYALLPENSLGMEMHISLYSYITLGGIFKLYPVDETSYALSLGYSRDSHHKAAYVKNMEVRLLGSVFTNSLSIVDNRLYFSGSGLISSFPASIICTADTSSDWNSLMLKISGWFHQETDDSLPKKIEEAVRNKVKVKARNAKDRANQAEMDRVEIADELDNITRDLDGVVEEKKLQDALVDDVGKLLNETVASVGTQQAELDEATGTLQQARDAVDTLCTIEDCEFVCIPTRESRIEYVDEFTTINGTCYVLTNETVQVEAPSSYVQKTSWEFEEVCETAYTCVDRDYCQSYHSCLDISRPIISYCPTPDIRDNIMRVSLHPTACVEKVFNRTVKKLITYTNPCGKMIPDTACLNRSFECQIMQDKVFHLLEEKEEGLTEPLQLLNEAKNNVTVLQNDLVRYELKMEALQSEQESLMCSLDSAQTQNASLHNNHDKLLESLETGLMLSSLLNKYGVEDLFTITNVTFSSTIIPNKSDNQSVLLEIHFKTVNGSEIVVNDDINLSRISNERLITTLANLVFRSVFEREPNRKRSLEGKHQKRQTLDETEEQFYLQCAQLNNILSYILHLQSTLKEKSEQISQLLEDIEKLLQDLGATDPNATYTATSGNYTRLENGFNITKDKAEKINTTTAENAAIDSSKMVIDEVEDQAEQETATAEQNGKNEWENDNQPDPDEGFKIGGKECISFADCLHTITGVLDTLIGDAPEAEQEKILKVKSYPQCKVALMDVATKDSLTISQALHNLSCILSVVQAMVDMGYWCASLPQIVSEPELVVNVTIGGNLTLECEAASTIPLTYTWMKDGRAIPESHSNVLTIINMRLDDEGSYTCLATNYIGSTESRRSIVQIYSLPAFTLQPKPVTTFIGDENNARFTCNGTGRPTPGWFWEFRHNHEEEWSMVSNHQSNDLFIRKPGRAHEGQYRCIAYNWHGSITSKPVDLKLLEATLSVTTIPMKLKLTRVVAIGDNEKQKRSTNDIEEQILNQLMDTFDMGSVTIQHFSISTSDDGELLLVRFVLVGANVTSETNNTSSFLEEVLPLLTEAEKDIVRLRQEIETYFSMETFDLEYNGSDFNSTNDSITIETTSILCPPGQELHDNRIHCVNCLAGEHQVSETDERVVDNQVKVEVVPRCVPCPLDTYQEHVGGVECQSCPVNNGTITTGSTSKNDCIGFCTPNHYSPNGLEPCTPCEEFVNYQPYFAQTSCIPCLSKGDDPYCGEERLDVFLSGDSPIVSRNSVTFILKTNKPVYKLQCKISGTSYRDCSSGEVTFTDLKWRQKNKYYTFRADAITATGEQFTLKRKFMPEESGQCTVHLTNRGVSVDGSTVTVNFSTTGPVSSISCILDGSTMQDCSSPAVFSELAYGVHHLKIRPLGCLGKKSQYPLSLSFIIN